MFAALKRCPMGCHCPFPENGAAQMSLEWKPSDATSSIFHFCGTLLFYVVFYIVSRAIAQMIDRGGTCGNVRGERRTYTLFVSIIRPETGYELKGLKE